MQNEAMIIRETSQGYIREDHDLAANRNGDYYSEQDIKKVAQAITPCQNSHDPYWDYAAQMYLEAISLFVLNQLPEEQHDLYTVYTFLTRMGTTELESMIEEECALHPDSAFARKIGMIRQHAKAERMDASIKGILAQHLDVVAWPGARHMFRMERQVDLGAFLHGKTALFLSVSDSDRSQDPLINIFYIQALQYLMSVADKQPDSRLPIPVRFIQAKCRSDAAFALLVMHPDKTMINCFQYINRKAREYAEQEMKDLGIERTGTYGCDVPDGLCFQWAEDYFNDPDAKEDRKDDEKFVPKPYVPNQKTAKAKTAKTKSDKKKPAAEKPKPKAPVLEQASLF